MPQPKIAIVHDAMASWGGGELVVKALHDLFPNAPIYTSVYNKAKLPQFKSADIRTTWLNNVPYFRNHHQITFPLMPYAFEQLDLSSYDIVISSSASAAKGVITQPQTLHISYCHTPTRWIWSPQLDPRASSSLLRRTAAHYLRIWDLAAAQRVDQFVANSHYIAAKIQKFYRRDATVIYPPIELPTKTDYGDREDYFLSVCRLVSQKRVDIIIEACRKIDVPLKIVGVGPELKRLKKLAGASDKIEFLGFVDDRAKAKLMAKARAFVFASEEDFGIVPVEAMSFGTPVICYSRGGASESVISGTTGLHFHSQTADSLALAIQEFDDQKFDAGEIRTHAAKFSADRFRNEITKLINDEWQRFRLREIRGNAMPVKPEQQTSRAL